MPIHTPPDSTAASMIQAFAWIIPVLALGLLLLAAPGVRAAVAQTYTRAREYFYGPEPVATSQGSSETDPKDGAEQSEPASSSHDNLDTFDRSFYSEDEEQDP